MDVLSTLLQATTGDEDPLSVQRGIAAGMIRRTSLAMTRFLDLVLRPLGMTFARYHVLSVLHHSESGRLTLTELADHLLIQPATMTGLVNRLAQDGHVERTKSKGDGRSFHAEITALGRDAYCEAQERLRVVDRGITLELEQLRVLNSMLNEVYDSTTTAFDQYMRAQDETHGIGGSAPSRSDAT